MFEYDVNVNVCPSPDLFLDGYFFFCWGYALPLLSLSLYFRFTNRFEKFACTRQCFTT